ncbi:MAG: hypothetical protein HY216_10355 [Candidatus Rokubacteria bacterium]|nr:hypothetical protein [Candidatus Rokubacteria bacterium]
MNGLLVRIGIDHAYGNWNAPVNPVSGHFVYVPIPEDSRAAFQNGMGRSFGSLVPRLEAFCREQNVDLRRDLKFPAGIVSRHMHLDPDFDFLTYGDDGNRRGAGILKLSAGDLVVFYAGLRPVAACEHRLIYALVGLYVVDEIIRLPDVPIARWIENAHTRKLRHGQSDVIVRARPRVSGRLERCIPIGELRDRAYRVRNDVLAAWGGLSVKDGYIQRSAVPPSFLSPKQFYGWFLRQQIALIASNG